MNSVIKWAIKTALGRWVTASLIALLLGGGAWKWHAFKEDLIHKGQQVCVQEINKETVAQLEDALAAEKSARAELTANLIAAAAVNQAAIDRRNNLETQVSALERAMAEQARTDDEYKAWSNTTLPSGVADRLRVAQAGDNSSPLRDDPD
jgi:hypothetical protein